MPQVEDCAWQTAGNVSHNTRLEERVRFGAGE
jgi:hypothetical protein